MEDELMTAAQVAKVLGIPAPTIYRMVKDGEVKYIDATKAWHKQKHYLFRVEDVQEAIDRRAKDRRA